MLHLVIIGKPIAKKRPRFFRRGKFVGTYNPQETEEGRWMWSVKQQLPPNFKPITGPVKIKMLFAFDHPKSWSKKKKEQNFLHTSKPDLDNLEKFVLDCLRDFVLADDAAVAQIESIKCYSRLHAAYTEIEIKKLVDGGYL